MMSTRNKIIACLVVILLSVFFGWKSNTIYTGYLNEKILLKQEAVQETIRAGQAEIAKQFEEQKVVLHDLAEKNKSTTTKIIQENQSIYSQTCIDQAGLHQLKKYKDASRGLK